MALADRRMERYLLDPLLWNGCRTDEQQHRLPGLERAFPVADAWLALASAWCAINCVRRRPQAVLWALVASGASVYLGCMDTLYNLEHGKYACRDAGMILEMLINLSSFASPAILIPYFWRNRRWFGT